MGEMDLEKIYADAQTEIQEVSSVPDLEAARIKFTGRKGLISQYTSLIPTLPAGERAAFGQKVNSLKNRISALLDEKQQALKSQAGGVARVNVDIGLPGIAQQLGHLHPVTLLITQISDLFKRMGFVVIEGPEVETEFNNFTGLNIPLDHPSRDAFDTFYLDVNATDAGKYLLRSHTSPVQIRAMKASKPPLAVLAPGRVYRPDAVDASHSFMFHQVEGFVVDTDITFRDLKGTLELFAKGIFGKDIALRFRPHFFPFTEPSMEADISCIICKGKGCPVCGRKGWLEVLGAGMIHPNVFKHVGYDPKKYRGFAFGMGVDRIAMLKYQINDIRLLYENDLRFLQQF